MIAIRPWCRTLAICLPIMATTPSDAGGVGGNADAGRRLAESLCAPCHAIGTKGDSALAAAPPFRELGRRWPLENLAEALAEGIVTRHPAMPAFEFTPRQIDDFLTYLESIQTGRPAASGR